MCTFISSIRKKSSLRRQSFLIRILIENQSTRLIILAVRLFCHQSKHNNFFIWTKSICKSQDTHICYLLKPTVLFIRIHIRLKCIVFAVFIKFYDRSGLVDLNFEYFVTIYRRGTVLFVEFKIIKQCTIILVLCYLLRDLNGQNAKSAPFNISKLSSILKSNIEQSCSE